MASLTQQTWGLSKRRDIVKDREAWRAAVHGVTESRTGLSNGTIDCRYLVIKLYFWLAGLHLCFLFWITPGGIHLPNSKQPHQPTQVMKDGQNHVNSIRKWICWPGQALSWPLLQLMAWLQPLRRPWNRITQLNCSSITDTENLWEIANIGILTCYVWSYL